MKRFITAIFLFSACVVFTMQAQNALERSLSDIKYAAEVQSVVSAKHTSPDNGQFSNAPFWFQANKHGLSSVNADNGRLRLSVSKDIDTDWRDNMYKWNVGYGIDVATAYNYQQSVIVQQLYADIQWKWLRLSVGSKERPMELKNNDLSSGSQTFGINAKPIPQVRLEVPDYVYFSPDLDWFGFKGHFGYGMLTDGGFQDRYLTPGLHYVSKARFHTKAGYVRLGNEYSFPLSFEGGLEWACIFGGEARNILGAGNNFTMPSGVKDYFKAIYGGGSDQTDGSQYANAAGNTLGSWTLRLNYRLKDWRFSVYMDHFFEDHSQLFLEYGWRDGMYGIEVDFPKNPVVSNLVYEYITTKDQSGPIYHDYTSTIPDQISAYDNYYNHAIYQGWQHWGQAIGNPFYYTPLYQHDGTLSFSGNRFNAHHFGISGQPFKTLRYKILCSYSENWGTYQNPYADVKYNTSMLAEINWMPKRIGRKVLKGWNFGVACALDRGSHLGNNTGVQFTVRKTGIFNM